MEILIDVSGKTDQFAEDLYSAIYLLDSENHDSNDFLIERIYLEEDIDDWEHVRALRIYDFVNEEIYYTVCNFLNQVPDLSYDDL